MTFHIFQHSEVIVRSVNISKNLFSKNVLKNFMSKTRFINGYRFPFKDFSVITKAKQADMLKRDKLEAIYSTVSDCLKQMDDGGISVLNTFFQNLDISKLFDEQRDRLKKTDYHLVVAGNYR